MGMMKDYLKESDLEGQEYNLALKESKLKIRDFLDSIKRDDKGRIILPTLILEEEGEVSAVLNSSGELKDWLRSKG